MWVHWDSPLMNWTNVRWGGGRLYPPSAFSLPVCDSMQEAPGPVELGDPEDAPEKFGLALSSNMFDVKLT